MQTLLLNLAVILFTLLVLWLISLRIRDVSIVDAFWGTGFAIIAWVSLIAHWPGSARLALLTSLITIWGARLSIHLFIRNHGKPEDARYAAMRDKHGSGFWWVSLVTVFLLQGLLLWIISFPVQAVAINESVKPLGTLDVAGVLLWLTGFLFESVGDWQLAVFKSDPANRGRVLDRGLWRYTRHPNYFGDFCVWWGIYLVAFSGGAAWTIVSPILMSFLLLKVSGVSLLEKDITERRPEYAEYQRQTSPFFPWPPKSD